MSRKFKAYLAILLCSLVWGSSFILMKKGLVAFPPDQVTAIRLTVAGLFLAPVAFYYASKRQNYPWRYLALAGWLGNVIPGVLYPLAMRHIDSATTAILNATSPFFTLAFGWLFFKLKFQPRHALGILLGLIGVFALSWSGKALQATLGHSALVLVAALSYGFNINLVKQRLSDLNAAEFSSFALIFSAAPSALYLLTTDLGSRLFESPLAMQALGYLVVLGVLGTALTRMLFFIALKFSNVVFASSVMYFIPIIATFWGAIDNEPLGIWHFTGLGLILSGIALVNKTE
jgi:drug/metabolite transporter (DMT)-like permease